MLKTVLFQAIQFSISTRFSSILPIDRTLSGTNTLGQSWPWSECNEGILHIPQSSRITGTSPWDCLVSYWGHSLRVVLSYCRESVGIFYSHSRLGHSLEWGLVFVQRFFLKICVRRYSKWQRYSRKHENNNNFGNVKRLFTHFSVSTQSIYNRYGEYIR